MDAQIDFPRESDLTQPPGPPPAYLTHFPRGPHRTAADDASSDDGASDDFDGAAAGAVAAGLPLLRFQTTAFVVTTDGIRAVPVGGPFFTPPRPAPLLTAAAMQHIGAPLSLPP